MRYRESKKMRGMQSSKMGSYADTKVEDWAGMKESPIQQYDNGSMNYKNRTDAKYASDAKKIKSSILPQ